jgi:hypothetical protein
LVTRREAAGLLLALVAAAPLPACARSGKTGAPALSAFLDSLQVESRWPAGVHVDWETGLPDGKTESFEGHHTHCSAFVASAAKQLGVYILRPPEHGQMLLANAQFEWLRDKGAADGWLPVADTSEAQRSANAGRLVVATFENPDPQQPGHIAIVRPSDRDRASLEADGASIIMAGEQNYNSTTVRHGFANHPTAWDDNQIRY